MKKEKWWQLWRKQKHSTRPFCPRPGQTSEIVKQIKGYLEAQPADYCEQMDTLLDELGFQGLTLWSATKKDKAELKDL